MTRGKGGKTQELLSNTEKQGLLDSRRELEGQLKDAEEFGRGTPAEQMDKSALKKQINRIDQAIEDRTPPKVSGMRKDELVKECEGIREKLSQGMPTRYEMDHPAKSPGAVRKHLAWLKRNQALIERHRTIQRMVNPDEPRSVEELRKEK